MKYYLKKALSFAISQKCRLWWVLPQVAWAVALNWHHIMVHCVMLCGAAFERQPFFSDSPPHIRHISAWAAYRKKNELTKCITPIAYDNPQKLQPQTFIWIQASYIIIFLNVFLHSDFTEQHNYVNRTSACCSLVWNCLLIDLEENLRIRKSNTVVNNRTFTLSFRIIDVFKWTEVLPW